MKLLVVGASGGLGRQLVEQALADGHQVSAFVRNPEAFQIQHSALTVVHGDIMKPETVEPALEGHDVVLSAAGGGLGATTIYSQGVGNVITAMEKQGIGRFICVTSAGISDEDAATQGFFYAKIFRPLFLKDAYADMRILETHLQASSLNWIGIHPLQLTNGLRTGVYRVPVNGIEVVL